MNHWSNVIDGPRYPCFSLQVMETQLLDLHCWLHACVSLTPRHPHSVLHCLQFWMWGNIFSCSNRWMTMGEALEWGYIRLIPRPSSLLRESGHETKAIYAAVARCHWSDSACIPTVYLLCLSSGPVARGCVPWWWLHTARLWSHLQGHVGQWKACRWCKFRCVDSHGTEKREEEVIIWEYL